MIYIYFEHAFNVCNGLYVSVTTWLMVYNLDQYRMKYNDILCDIKTD